MVLGELPMPGHPTNLDYRRAKACLLFGHFFSRLSFLSFFLSLGDGPIQTKIPSQRAVKPKTTNQPIYDFASYFEHHLVVIDHMPGIMFKSGAAEDIVYFLVFVTVRIRHP